MLDDLVIGKCKQPIDEPKYEEAPRRDKQGVESPQVASADAVVEQRAVVVVAFHAVIADFAVRGTGLADDVACRTWTFFVECSLLED